MRYDAVMLDIGGENQVFVDDLIVESIENVCRTWHQPVRAGEDPIIISDQAWEKITYFTFNSSQVIRDPKDGLFKCVYQSMELSSQSGESPLGTIVSRLFNSHSGERRRRIGRDFLRVLSVSSWQRNDGISSQCGTLASPARTIWSRPSQNHAGSCL